MNEITGKVISTKMVKTIVVEVTRQQIHPLYKKIMRKSRKYKAHSEDPNIKVGDIVQIGPSRPISKEKHYKLLKLLR